jgi:hypothetical protein
MAINVDELVMQTIVQLEQAKTCIETLRAAKVEEAVDGRALSVAVTYLETAQLWVANARR